MDPQQTNWFGHCRTTDEVKAEYRRLCFMYHPDRGGDSTLMQAINRAYRVAVRGQSSVETARSGAGPLRYRPPAAADPGDAHGEYSRDDVRRLWRSAPWQAVAQNQLRRTVGAYRVTLIQFADPSGPMWAIQVGDQFSKFAYQTRSEAEEDAFNLLVQQVEQRGM